MAGMFSFCPSAPNLANLLPFKVFDVSEFDWRNSKDVGDPAIQGIRAESEHK
jgi:hypothetical protein